MCISAHFVLALFCTVAFLHLFTFISGYVYTTVYLVTSHLLFASSVYMVCVYECVQLLTERALIPLCSCTITIKVVYSILIKVLHLCAILYILYFTV